MSLYQEAYELAQYIKNQKKVTPVKVYIKGNLDGCEDDNIKIFGRDEFWILFGDYNDIKGYIDEHQENIVDMVMESDRRNSAIPLLDLKEIDARIEPGAMIREHVEIGKNAVIMMGAVINIGAKIGEGTMIDMNAVVGSRAIIGKNVHIGAGSVIAGVLEPPGKTPVIIENKAFIGANAVILEGIRIGEGAVVAAGAVVTKDVLPNQVVAGVPAKVIKSTDSLDADKTTILDDLRG